MLSVTDFDDMYLEALTRVEKTRTQFEQAFYSPAVNAMGRALWEGMTQEQRAMMLEMQPGLADGVRKMLGGV